MPTVDCPHCAARLAADPAWVGRTVACGDCGRRFEVAAVDTRDDPPDLAWAADRVRGPARRLAVVGWAVLAVGLLKLGLVAGNAVPAEWLAGGLASAAVGGLLVEAAGRMRRLRSYRLVRAAAWVSFAPMVLNPCCCCWAVGWVVYAPAGVAVLRVLGDPDVRRAFDYDTEADGAG